MTKLGMSKFHEIQFCVLKLLSKHKEGEIT